MKRILVLTLVILLSLVGMGWVDDVSAPTVTTQAVVAIASTTATGNGTITADGGETPTENGVVVKIGSGTPTILDYDFKFISTDHEGTFTASMTGLSGGVLYKVRAFATNSTGTGYGDILDFRFSYVAQAGTAANIAAATGVAYPDNYMNVAVHNAATFIPGDTIFISDEGGDFTSGIVPPSSGSDTNPIIYTNAPGETPIINLSWSKTKVQNETLWALDNGSVYKTTADLSYYANVIWEDDAAIHGIWLSAVNDSEFTWNPETAWTGWDSGWTHNLPNNSADHTSGTAPLEQAIGASAGKVFLLSYYLQGCTAGSVTPSIGGTNFTTTSTNGWHVETRIAANSTNLKFTPTNDFDGKIKNVYAYVMTPGSFIYAQAVMRTFYYPTTGAPSDHDLKSVWVQDGATIGFDIKNRSNIEISGMTIRYCAFGFYTGDSGSASSLVKNVKIHHNNIDHTYWAVFGNLAHDSIQQDTDIYNNTIDYCNCGISIWSTDSDPIVGHLQQALRVKVYDNTINNHFFADDITDWAVALNYPYMDHEAISFQDMKDCEVTGNTVTLPRAPNTNYENAIYQPRALCIYLTPNSGAIASGNIISHNRFNGCFHTAMSITFQGNSWGDNKISCNVMRSDFSVPDSFGIFFYASNISTSMNYICNNTFDYPVTDVVFYAIYHGANNGKWTIKNNIVKGYRMVSAESLTNITYDYNDYYAYMSLTPFRYAAGQKSFTEWKALTEAPDQHSDTLDPVLRPADSAITSLSPATVKTGGTPISGITYSGSRGLPGVDGKLFSVTSPAMGAYAQTSPIYLTTFSKNRILNHILGGK